VDPATWWREWWRGATFAAPLSGDVAQTIDTALFRAIGDQLGFININTAGAGNPQLERRITEQVASYGRQLGRILDALDVLIRHVDLSDLPPEDARTIAQLVALCDEIEEVKRKAAAEDIDRLVAQARRLREDPEANREALDRLRQAIEEG
jgi:hypothetical protein